MKTLFALTQLTAMKEVKNVSFDRYIPELGTSRCIIRFKTDEYYCVIRPSDLNPGMYEYWDCNSDKTADDIYVDASELVDVIINGYKNYVDKFLPF